MNSFKSNVEGGSNVEHGRTNTRSGVGTRPHGTITRKNLCRSLPPSGDELNEAGVSLVPTIHPWIEPALSTYHVFSTCA
jgi:hypothetical protein